MTSLRFRDDGTFRVLQMADVQDKPDVEPDTIRLIREAIRAADPDLVVFTGDQIRGYDPAYIDTFLRRRGEEPGARVRVVTELEAKLQGVKRQPRVRAIADGVVDRLERANLSQAAGSVSAHMQASASGLTLDEMLDETRAKVRRTFRGFLRPVVEAGVPFAATYGNHDFQCGILAEEQDDIYREFPGCLNPAELDALSFEAGTFALPVAASNDPEHIAMSVVMVNSGDYADHNTPEERDSQYPAYAVNPRGFDLADSDGYGTPSAGAIAWMKTVQSELKTMNGDGKPVPSIAFQHIPPQEFYDVLKEVPAWTPNAVEGARTHAGHCYVLDSDKCRPGSRIGEAIGCADENVGQVRAMCEAGGYFALFCGHDHKNAFVGHAHGIDLGYAPTCGFECYGPKSRYRGIRLFEFHEDNPEDYDTRMLTWGDLVGRYSSNELRVWFEDHCITDAIGVRNELRRPQVFAVVAGAVSLGFAAVVRSILNSCGKR